MTPGKRLAISEGFSEEFCRRKRLGQYFSGTGLGRVLGALALANKAKSIVDPMAGNGDLLKACLELGARPKYMGAVEIDPVAQNICQERLPKASCILGNVFDPDTLSKLPRKEWDLVITNPPYVRYQNMAKEAGRDFKLPSATDVRNGLKTALDGMPALDKTDYRLFKHLASGYSGLADFAVPSWILCASMVALNGHLALVVPESWLTRNYAAVVHYLLLRWFRIEYVVEDEHAVWFDDAQVKTTLLVARRIKRLDSAFSWGDSDTFVHTKVSGKSAGKKGPIANLHPYAKKPEILLANKVQKVLESSIGFKNELVSIFPSQLGHMADKLKAASSKQKWFSIVEDGANTAPVSHVPPDLLLKWMGSSNKTSLVSLELLGITVGQGLRTGANGYFYATLLSTNGTQSLISPNGVPGIDKVKVPNYCLRPVVRRQSELPDGYIVHEENLAGRTLDLRTLALPEDIKAAGKSAKQTYRTMPKELASFVRKTARINFGKPDKPKRIYQLSAVLPNIRKADPSRAIPPRFWYMLPDFTHRHLPDLLVPRINSKSPKAYIIPDKGVLVDANFSTINLAQQPNGPDSNAILALLNSSWCRAALEYSATVMGGGALKVEATHLRRLPVPKFSKNEWKRLSGLGHQLATTQKGISQINRIVAKNILGRNATDSEINSLSRLVEEGRLRRGKQNKGKRYT